MASLNVDVEAELLMLREFYDCWKAFHATPKDSAHRKTLERAAQRMVDASDTVERFRTSRVPEQVAQ